MWYHENDRSAPVLTAKQHVEGAHHNWNTKIALPAYCILFYMSDVIPYLLEQGAVCITEKLPRFLNGCPVYGFPDAPVCFLDGGRGAPQAVDTLETLHVLGVKTVLSVGMCGEAAASPKMIPLLISFGLTEFSVSAPSVLRVRKNISKWTKAEADAIAEKVMAMTTEEEINAYLDTVI